jgi:hypothetical protein
LLPHSCLLPAPCFHLPDFSFLPSLQLPCFLIPAYFRTLCFLSLPSSSLLAFSYLSTSDLCFPHSYILPT